MESPIGDIIKADIRNASIPGGGENQNFANPIEEICYYSSTEFDLGQAHFVTQINQAENEVLNLRLLVLSGDFSNAETLLKKASQLEDDESKAEFYLCEAQLLGHQNDWIRVISVAESGMKLDPAHITRISLMQCRAMALYELGYFNQALIDCEMILSQKSLYPSAVSVRYAYFLQQKVYLAKGHSLKVKKVLDNFWKDLKRQKNINLDFLLSLIRLQIDFNRSENLPMRSYALFSYLVAYKLSDKLYQAFALIDWYSSLSNPNLEITDHLNLICSSFKKANFLFEEFLNTLGSTTSAKRLIETNKECSLNHSIQPPMARYIVLCDFNLSIDLESKTRCDLSNSTDWAKFRTLFLNGSVDKKHFFEALWEQKYSYEKHDGVIRAFIYRLKKRTGIKIHSENGTMTLVETLVV